MQNSIDFKRTRVGIHKDRVSNVSASDFPFTYAGIDDSFDLEKWKKCFKVTINSIGKDELSFDLVGIDASIANAIRRFMIAEVPTVAIEEVYIIKNTGIMHDEVLAHRLGLIPLKVDPTNIEFREMIDNERLQDKTDLNTVVFHLQVSCTAKKSTQKDPVLPSEKFENSSVYSKHLVWQPQGDQEQKMEAVGPVDDDILITKLRPGQQLHLEVHAVKGIGKDHAKFSPVCSLGYRLLPEIRILKPISGPDAREFQSCFPKGVIEVFKDKNGVEQARVANARLDTVSRECLRYPKFEEKVQLARVRNHFIFHTESTGAIPPRNIVTDALKGLVEKIGLIREAVEIL